jgi:hypothetical protein
MTNPAVEAWMDAYNNPLKPLVQQVRLVILGADARVTETIKWQAPTFMYRGNIASFFPKSKAHVSLMFHTGASIAGDFPILEGTGPGGRTVRILDAADLAAKSDMLQAVIRAWCDGREGPSPR